MPLRRRTSCAPAHRTSAFGDEETLKQTPNTQPCLYTVEMAASQACWAGVTRIWWQDFPWARLAALTGGAVDFENGIKMVTRRGQLMQAAAEKVDSAMIAVMKLEASQVEHSVPLTRRPIR